MTTHSSRPTGESGRALRTLALVAVVVGLVALTTAACVLSYAGVHDLALRAGISHSLARIYPDIGDAMLVIAGCSVLALRGAGLLSKMYGWLCFIVLLGALAASSVVHDAGLSVPLRAAEITAAVFPWALVLVAFGLLLALLRYARRRRQAQRAGVTAGDALATAEPSGFESAEPGAYEAAEQYDAGAFVSAGEYEGGEQYGYDTLQATSDYAPVSPDETGPAVPPPRTSVDQDETPAQSSRAVIQPAQMQLRARASRLPEPAEGSTANPPEGEPPEGEPLAGDQPDAPQSAGDHPAAEPSVAAPTPPAGPSVTEPPTSGFTGNTISGSELSPAPTADQPSAGPPKLDRPRSSPTPPS